MAFLLHKQQIYSRLRNITTCCHGRVLTVRSHSSGIALAVPHHPSAYKSGDENKIDQIGHNVLISVIDTMIALGWIERRMGFRTGEDTGETTELRPLAMLLKEFQKAAVAWHLTGLVLIALALTGIVGVWGWIGIVTHAAGLFEFCPAHRLLGFNTIRNCS